MNILLCVIINLNYNLINTERLNVTIDLCICLFDFLSLGGFACHGTHEFFWSLIWSPR